MDSPDDVEMKMVEDKISPKVLNDLVRKRTAERRAKLTEKFVAALTLHGYSQFHEAGGIRKVFWAIILLCMAMFFIGLTYLSYYSDSYYSQVVEFKDSKMKSVEFPTVTICNYNPVRAADMHKRFPVNVTKREFLTFYYQVLSNRGNVFEFYDNELLKRIIPELKAKGYTSYTDILQLFEISAEQDVYNYVIKEMMGSYMCLYDFRRCNLTKDFRTVSRNSGQSVCKQFNYYQPSKAGRNSSKTGISSGLLMYWSLEGKQYFYDYSLQGLLVEIHHYGTPQHLIDYNNFISLEPGVFTTIEMQQVKTKRLPPPFKPNCGPIAFKIIDSDSYPYSSAMCEVDCLLQKTLQKCGCIGDQFAEHVLKGVKICNLTEMACTFQDLSTSAMHEQCHHCPVECDAIDYKTSTSRIAIGNEAMYKIVKRLPGWKNKSTLEIKSYIKENIVGFRIGFKSLEVKERTYKEAIKWYERISMVGGSIGLLLGFSFITGFELLFFIFDYITTPMYIRTSRRHLGDRKSLGDILRNHETCQHSQ